MCALGYHSRAMPTRCQAPYSMLASNRKVTKTGENDWLFWRVMTPHHKVLHVLSAWRIKGDFVLLLIATTLSPPWMKEEWIIKTVLTSFSAWRLPVSPSLPYAPGIKSYLDCKLNLYKSQPVWNLFTDFKALHSTAKRYLNSMPLVFWMFVCLHLSHEIALCKSRALSHI